MLIGCFIFGLLGVLAISFGFPLLALILRELSLLNSKKPLSKDSNTTTRNKRIAVLIPAHNASATLSQTLTSVNCSTACLLEKNSNFHVNIYVGADGCSDNTAKLALEAGITVIASQERVGKWNTLHKLFESVESADWVIFCDAGAQWTPSFLEDLSKWMESSEIVAIAPSYHNPAGSLLERAYWYTERKIKALENLCGGPVSVHGATVCYRSSEVEYAIEMLNKLSENANWLNDDVVLPLMLRTVFADKIIKYTSKILVRDTNQVGYAPEFNRRKRMVIGNIQWIRTVLPFVRRTNRLVFLLALRRVFRVFWAYWLILFFLPLIIFAAGSLLDPFVMIGITALLIFLFCFRRGKILGLLDSICASLLSPGLFIGDRLKETPWK